MLHILEGQPKLLIKPVVIVPANMFILGQIHGKKDGEFGMSGGLHMRWASPLRALYFSLFLGLEV